MTIAKLIETLRRANNQELQVKFMTYIGASLVIFVPKGMDHFHEHTSHLEICVEPPRAHRNQVGRVRRKK